MTVMEDSKECDLKKEQNGRRISSDESNCSTATKHPQTSEVPIDRGWAWMAVLGCFGVHVFVVGAAKSIGVLMVEILDRFDNISAKQISLVPGLTATLMMGLGLVTNLLAARFTCRAVVFLGGLLSCVGFITTGFIDRFWMLYLTYSLTAGLGYALSYSPSIVFLGSHFKERRSLANGLSLAGSGIGSFILPNLMRVMLKTYGLPGCCMITGALILHVCICGLLFRPHANYRQRLTKDVEAPNRVFFSNMPSVEGSAYTDQEKMDLLKDGSEDKNVPTHNGKDFDETEKFEMLKLGTQDTSKIDFCHNVVTIGDTEDKYDPELAQIDLDRVEERLQLQSTVDPDKPYLDLSTEVKNYHQHNGSRQPSHLRSSRSLFAWSLLSDPVFFLYILFALFATIAYPNVFFMLPMHAEDEGENRDSSALLLSFIGITDLMGRLFIGWFTDLKLFESRYALVASAFISGLLCILMPVFKSFGGLAFYAITYGFFAGCYVTLIPVVLSDTLGPEKLASSFGLVPMAMAVSLIPAPIACGQIKDSFGSWKYSFMFLGAVVVLGSLFPLLQPCVQKNRARPKKPTEY